MNQNYLQVLHLSDVVGDYTFKAEDDWGWYNENGEYCQGSINKCGYHIHRRMCVDGKQHNLLEHRMKWEYFYGKIPSGMVIDHIIPIKNGGTNKLSNLRLVTPEQNYKNPISRKNWSIAASKKVGLKNPFYGKKWNDNQREAHKKLWKRVKRVLHDGSVEIYNNVAIAATETNLSLSSIAYACRGKYGNFGHNYKDSQWYYE